jgi:biopolymer transport protein ExbD
MAGRGHRSIRSHRLSHKKSHVVATRNDINVTPLVDVMLVLLIIFMVLAPLMARGRNVPSLPAIRNFSSEKDKLQPVVALDENEVLWYDKEKLGPISPSTLKQLGENVHAAWNAPRNPDAVGKIYIKASGELDYGKVAPLLKYVNAPEPEGLGVQSIDLATAELKESK